jgi:hypothetical protein
MIVLLWLLLAILASPFKSKCQLEVENVALRHQVVVLRRQVRGRVRLTNIDQLFLVQVYLSFPKIPSDLNWHDGVESLHCQGRCLRSFMQWECLSPTYSSRVVGLKPRISFSVIS